MDSVVRVKDGVLFTKIAPSGFRLLEAISIAARDVGFDLTITSACDGEHSGPTDPHHRGEAYDVRSHGLTIDQKSAVTSSLGNSLPLDQFYFFLEDPGGDNEHIHLQVKKGTTYP
jgi:hypothetical protein